MKTLYFKSILLCGLLLISGVINSAAQNNDTEKLFLEYTEGLYKAGQNWSEAGYSRQADWFYGQAAAAICGWRTAIAEIARGVRNEADKKQLEKDKANLGEYASLLESLSSFTSAVESFTKNVEKVSETLGSSMGIEPEESDESRLWDTARSYSMVSPYPDYFRAIVYDWKGEADAARKYYKRAALNSFFPGYVFSFSFLADLDFKGLAELSERLKKYQVRYVTAMSDTGLCFKYDAPTWDASALARTAAFYLNPEHRSYARAQDYLEAAMYADPFEVKYVYLAALLYTQLGNGVSSARCLNEAMKMDPDNAALRNGVAKWNSFEEKKL